MQALERDGAIERFIVRAVDDAHPPFPDHLFDAIHRDARPGCDAHRCKRAARVARPVPSRAFPAHRGKLAIAFASTTGTEARLTGQRAATARAMPERLLVHHPGPA